MHRKRATSELHDSYFFLMTIKHAIPKIEWAIEVFSNSEGDRKSVSWRSDELETRCGRESHHPADGEKMRTCFTEAGPPSPRLSSLGEREGHTATSGGAREVNMLQFCSVSNSLSHTQPFQWSERYIFLKKSSLVFIHYVSMYSACICVYKHIYFVAIQHQVYSGQ